VTVLQQQGPSDIYVDAAVRMWGERLESVRCVLAGDCMAPRLLPGMELVIHLGVKRFRCGDIVMVGSDGGRLIQRIVKILRHGHTCAYLLKPDHRWEFLGPVATKDILGLVVEVATPKERRRLNTFSQKFISRLLAWRSYASGRTYSPTNSGWRVLASAARAWRRLRGDNL
jgi:hypothetical protein